MTDAPAPEQAVQPESSGQQSTQEQSEQKKVEQELRRFKVKIDGQEREIPEDEMIRDYQLAATSRKRFDEAAKIRKESQESLGKFKGLIENAKNGDLGWLKQVVPQDVLRQWAEKELIEHIEWNKMSPAEQRAIIAENKLQEKENIERQREEQLEEYHRAQLQAEADKVIEQDIYSAVKELGYDVKVTPRLIRRIAEDMYASLEASDDPQAMPVPAKVAREKAFQSLMDEAKELLSVLEPEKALALLPPSLRDAIRKQDVAAVRGQMDFKPKKAAVDDEPIRTKRKVGTLDDYFKRLETKIKKREGSR